MTVKISGTKKEYKNIKNKKNIKTNELFAKLSSEILFSMKNLNFLKS